MDMSKLPRLSRTEAPPPPSQQVGHDPHDPPPPPPPYPDYRREDPDGLIGSGVEMWMTAAIGVLFLFFGLAFAKHLFAATSPYPPIAGTGIVWSQGTPDAGKEVPPNQLAEPHKTEYFQRIEGRKLLILGDASLLAFGCALILDALVRLLYRIGVPGRRALVGLALALTAAAVAFNLLVIAKLFAAGITPLYSFMAFAFGGLVLYLQWQLFQVPAGLSRAAPASVIAPSAQASTAAAAAAAARQVVTQALGAADKPRCAHFRFAHHALRQAAFENPAKCVGMLQGPESGRFLRELWEAVRAGCGPSATPGDDAADGLESEMTQLGPYAGAMVSLPAARVRGEAHQVALVLRSYARADGSVVERHPLLLYYALEAADGTRDDGAPRTTLCEWQGGDHVSFGEGPPPDPSSFRAALQERVAAQQKREDELAAHGGAM